MAATDPARPPAGPRAVGVAALVERAERLWCLVGHHVPNEGAVWHGGYGFAYCRRCNQAIVRSLLSNWTVPGPGLRIVWKGEGAGPTPANVPRSASAAETRAPAGDNVVDTVTPDSAVGSVKRPKGKAAFGKSIVDQPSAKAAVGGAETDRPSGSVPLVSVPAPDLEANPIDLLGPHFMGDKGAPPGPSEGLSVFEFDDMADDDDTMPRLGVASQNAR